MDIEVARIVAIVGPVVTVVRLRGRTSRRRASGCHLRSSRHCKRWPLSIRIAQGR